MSLTNKIYHDCAGKYEDRTRLLINFGNGEKCICLTSNPYWGNPNTISHKTVQKKRSETKKWIVKGPNFK